MTSVSPSAQIPAPGVKGITLPLIGNSAFKVPPLDGSLSVGQIYDWHLQHSPEWVYATYKQSGTIVEVKWRQMGHAIHTAARYTGRVLGGDPGHNVFPSETVLGKAGVPSPPVVAVVANMPPLTYFAICMGIIRAGGVCFPISINNSSDALTHLLQISHSTFLFVGPKGSSPDVDTLVETALSNVKTDIEGRPMQIIPWPDIEQLFIQDRNATVEPLPYPPLAKDTSPALILHSSGTTSFPKPIYLTQRSLIALAREGWWGNRSLVGNRVFSGHLPPWHAFGYFFGAAISIGSGTTTILKEYVIPPKPVTPESLLPLVVESHPHIFVGVPTIFETWARSQSSREQLRDIECVCSGGPLAHDAAASLVQSHVEVHSLLASTEGGIIASWPTSQRDPFLFRISAKHTYFLRPEKDFAKTHNYELVLGSNPHFIPHVLNDKYIPKKGEEPIDVFATSDLVQLRENGLLEVVGRVDDQIMHSNGEKTNPNPLVEIIARSPDVAGCIIFGRGKAHAGALVQPRGWVDPNNEAAVAMYRNRIWCQVEAANRIAPSHSKLFKEMIVIARPEKPWERTAKGSWRTDIVLKCYDAEIQAAYRAFENVAASTVVRPSTWTLAASEEYVSSVVAEAIGFSSEDKHADIFALGVDSLRATKINIVLSHAVGAILTPSFVYANPTIGSMAAALRDIVRGCGEQDGPTKTQHVDAMAEMVKKYSSTWPSTNLPSDRVPATGMQTVLLTGTTGGLGSFLLERFAEDERVLTVYAAIRRGHGSIEDRQKQALRSRGVDVSILSLPKVNLLETDLTRSDLGLTMADYSRLYNTVTLIVHNAWRLDFNLALSSFEPHIKGSRNLIDLALKTPTVQPRFLFISSIASASGYHKAEPVPEMALEHFEAAVGRGYGESKAVVEHILRNAPGLDATSIRIGQMSGSATAGRSAWAVTDWVPLAIKSAEKLGCLPTSLANIDWIATELVTDVVKDYAFHRHQELGETLHIANPNKCRWSEVFQPMADETNLPLVPFEEWLEKLREASKKYSLEELPTTKLLDFFEGLAKDCGEVTQLSIDRALKISPRLGHAPKLGAKEAKAWIAYWRQVGFLKI